MVGLCIVVFALAVSVGFWYFAVMSDQKELSRVERRDRLFSALRAFARSLGEHYGYAGTCDICGLGPGVIASGSPPKDGFGREHRPDCPWCSVDNAIIAVLEREHERKEQQRHASSGSLLQSCKQLRALAESQLVQLNCKYGSDRTLGQIEADGELPPAISEARKVILQATV